MQFTFRSIALDTEPRRQIVFQVQGNTRLQADVDLLVLEFIGFVTTLFVVNFLVLRLDLLFDEKCLVGGLGNEELLESFEVETVLRDGVQDESEADHDDLGDTTQVSEKIKQGVDSSCVMDRLLVHKQNSLVVRIFKFRNFIINGDFLNFPQNFVYVEEPVGIKLS